jgi:hypothetical protein
MMIQAARRLTLIKENVVFKKAFLVCSVVMLCSACATRGNQYSGYVDQEIERQEAHQMGGYTTDVSGPSNAQLELAEYRSDIEADTAENHARAQNAELGVINHRLDTERKAQHYDHEAHMDGNQEKRDDFWTIEAITGSVSDTVSNVDRTIRNVGDIFD